MTFTILICTRNSASKIREVINSINNQSSKNDILEIIVVDYNSIDNTLEIAAKELFKLNIANYSYSINKSGKSAALEFGLDKAKGDYALILDDDNILFPDFIQNTKDILQKNKTIGCLGSQGIADEKLQYPPWFNKYQSNFAIGLPVQAGETDWVWGAASIIKLEAWHLLRSGGFSFQLSPERTTHNTPIALGGEDVELALAIKLIGYTIDYSENIKFIHKFDQKRLNKYFIVSNNRGVVRSIAVHEMYRAFIYNPDNFFPFYLIWQFRFWKKVLSSFIHTIISFLLLYPKIDRQMNFAIFIGIISGYKQFSVKAPQIIKSLKKLTQKKFNTINLT